MEIVDRLADDTRSLILQAERVAYRYGDKFLRPQHLLFSFLEHEDLPTTKLLSLVTDVRLLRESLIARMNVSSAWPVDVTDLDPNSVQVLVMAKNAAHIVGDHFIEPDHLLMGVVMWRGLAKDVLKRGGVTARTLWPLVKEAGATKHLLRPVEQFDEEAKLLRPASSGRSDVEKLLRSSGSQ